MTLPSMRVRPRFGQAPQVGRVQSGIEVIGVAQRRQRRTIVRRGTCESTGARCHGAGIEQVVTQCAALGTVSQPEMMEEHAVHGHAVLPKWMDVVVPEVMPVDELDGQLEAGLCGTDEFGFVDLHGSIEIDDGRNRGLPHANGADVIGLDELDGVAATGQQLSESGRGHPACRAAADDQDAFNVLLHLDSARWHAEHTRRGVAWKPPVSRPACAAVRSAAD